MDNNNIKLCQFAQVWKLSCVMEASCEVIEYRGCDIEYTVFEGSYEDCEQWLLDNCFKDTDLMGDTNWVSNDPSHVNGNGFAWKYFIQVSF